MKTRQILKESWDILDFSLETTQIVRTKAYTTTNFNFILISNIKACRKTLILRGQEKSGPCLIEKRLTSLLKIWT